VTVTKLKNQKTARTKQLRRLLDQLRVKIQSFVAREKRLMRLMFEHFTLEICGFHAADVGRIARDYVEIGARASAIGKISLQKIHLPQLDSLAEMVALYIALRSLKRHGRHIRADDPRIWELTGEGDCDATGACANISDFQRFITSFAEAL
jgi:hypothetical protein